MRGQAPSGGRSAFTLLELLIVIAVIALLVAILLPSLSGAHKQAQRMTCTSKLRELGSLTWYFRQDYDDAMPRSMHSAFAHRARPWAYALFRYVAGREFEAEDGDWFKVLNSHYRCPFDRRTEGFSYGYNVYYELSEQETGGPIWRKGTRVPHPSTTILFGELIDTSITDHIMGHFWVQFDAPPEVAMNRHEPNSAYVFLDGHAENLAFPQTFDPGRGLDHWNPATAP